jgi:hypothetical protein
MRSRALGTGSPRMTRAQVVVELVVARRHGRMRREDDAVAHVVEVERRLATANVGAAIVRQHDTATCRDL